MKTNINVGVFLVVLGTFFFSLKSIFIKLAYAGGVSPEAVLILRQMIVVPLLWIVFIFYRGNTKFQWTKKTIFILFITGTLGFFLSPLFDFWGLAYVSAVVERMLFYTYTAFVILISLIHKKEKISNQEVTALILIYFGIFLSVGGWDIQVLKVNLKGTILILISSIMYALYLYGGGEIVKKLGTIRLNTFGMTIAAIFMFFYWLGGLIGNNEIELFSYDFSDYVYIVLIAVFTTFLPNILIFKGMEKIGASRTSIISMLGPVITILLGLIILNERPVWIQWIGFALVFFSTAYIELKKHNYFNKKTAPH